MYNPFDKLRSLVKTNHCTYLHLIFFGVFNGEYIVDVSRSSFYPDNEVTRLLTEIDEEYNEQDLDY